MKQCATLLRTEFVFACVHLRVSRWNIPPAVDAQQSIPCEWDVELHIFGVVNRNVKPPEESRRNRLDQLCPDSHLSPLYHPASLNHLFICQAKEKKYITYIQFSWFVQWDKQKRGRLDQVFSMWLCNISFIVLVYAMYSCHSKPDYLSSTEHKRSDFQRYSGCSFVCLSNEQAFRLQKEHKSNLL